MCNKKEGKRDRRWYLFPVSTLGAVYFAVHGGTGRVCFFPRRDGAGFFFFRGGTGWLFFFSTGPDGAFFFFFEGRDGTVVFGGGNFLGGTGQNRYTVPPKAVKTVPPAVHVKPWKFRSISAEKPKVVSAAAVSQGPSSRIRALKGKRTME